MTDALCRLVSCPTAPPPAVKHGIDVGAGVIDADYRGLLGILLFNFGQEDFTSEYDWLAFILIGIVSFAITLLTSLSPHLPRAVNTGDRIAQLVIERIHTPEVTAVDVSTPLQAFPISLFPYRSPRCPPLAFPLPTTSHSMSLSAERAASAAVVASVPRHSGRSASMLFSISLLSSSSPSHICDCSRASTSILIDTRRDHASVLPFRSRRSFSTPRLSARSIPILTFVLTLLLIVNDEHRSITHDPLPHSEA